METTLTKICPVCHNPFIAHPSAIYCKPRCAQRAKYQRRIARVFLTPVVLSPAKRPQPTSLEQYERRLINPTPEELTTTLNDISRYNYEREVYIEPIPPSDFPKPSDVLIFPDPDGKHAIAFHISRNV